MRFKEAVKDTNKSLSKIRLSDFWELGEAVRFYKQSFRDFIYATKNLLLCFAVIPFIVLFPVFYLWAIAIRMVKK